MVLPKKQPPEIQKSVQKRYREELNRYQKQIEKLKKMRNGKKVA